MFKTCSNCKKSKPTSEFYRHKITSDRLRTECKKCTNNLSKTRVRTSDDWKRYNLKNYYNLTPDDVQKILTYQNYLCPICKEDITDRYCVDHDRNCCPSWRSCGGCVRGLVCKRCNTLLGYIEKNNISFKVLSDYISGARHDDSIRF